MGSWFGVVIILLDYIRYIFYRREHLDLYFFFLITHMLRIYLKIMESLLSIRSINLLHSLLSINTVIIFFLMYLIIFSKFQIFHIILDNWTLILYSRLEPIMLDLPLDTMLLFFGIISLFASELQFLFISLYNLVNYGYLKSNHTVNTVITI